MNVRVSLPPLVIAIPLLYGCGDGGLTPMEDDVAVLTVDLPEAVALLPYAAQVLQATGGDGSYSWSLPSGSLPPGMSLSVTGTVQGTPSEPGAYAFTVRVASGGAGAEQTLTLTVLPPPSLRRSPEVMTLFVIADAPPSVPAALRLWNGGGGTLSWSLTSDVAWLAVTDGNGDLALDTVLAPLQVDPGGLASGAHEGRLTATVGAPADTAVVTSVSLHVVPTALPLLGYPLGLPDTASQSAGYLLGNAIVVTAPTTLTHLGVIATTAGPSVRLAIYTDRDGEPDALLAVSGSHTLVVGALEVEVEPTPLPVGVYWLMGVYESSARIGLDEDTDVLAKFVTVDFDDPMPGRFPAAFTYQGQAFNYYVRVADPQPPSGLPPLRGSPSPTTAHRTIGGGPPP